MKIKPIFNLSKQRRPLFKIPKDSAPYYVITGGPGVGKTSLLGALEKRGCHVVPEVSQKLIQEQQAIDGDGLPWKNKTRYRDLLFERSLERFENAMDGEHGNTPVFFDRGFLDAICYAAINGIPIGNSMKISAETCRYNDHVFILPPWKEIMKTDERQKQEWNEAVFTYNKIIQTYRGYRYNLVEVPKVSVGERADFILDHLKGG